MRMLDPQTWQFDMSYCLLLPVHSPGIPISITTKYCYYYPPPPFFLPLPKSQNVFSMHEYKHKLNQLCNKIWRDFYCTSHVYRMYKGRFEIKAGLNRNTSSKEDISPIIQRKEERREPRHRLVTGQQTAVLIYSTERCLILKRLSWLQIMPPTGWHKKQQFAYMFQIFLSSFQDRQKRKEKEKFRFYISSMQCDFSLFRACNSSWIFCEDVSNAL